MLTTQGRSEARGERRHTSAPLSWSMPLARWAAWSAAEDGVPDLAFVDLMLRRRLSALSKMAMKVAHECAGDLAQVKVLFASRHGELNRTTAILDDIVGDQPVSPTAFSLAVLNAMPGVLSIARHDRSASAALSAGEQTLGYALLEAYAQYRDEPGVPVLVVYAHEPAGDRYGPVADDLERGALALLIDANGPHMLDCELDKAVAEGRAGSEHSGTAREDTGHEELRHDGETLPLPAFPTHSRALLHTLKHLSGSTWQAPRARWSWHCHVSAH
jgi:Beta-ketoacyl synthase, N-terminal domain